MLRTGGAVKRTRQGPYTGNFAIRAPHFCSLLPSHLKRGPVFFPRVRPPGAGWWGRGHAAPPSFRWSHPPLLWSAWLDSGITAGNKTALQAEGPVRRVRHCQAPHLSGTTGWVGTSAAAAFSPFHLPSCSHGMQPSVADTAQDFKVCGHEFQFQLYPLPAGWPWARTLNSLTPPGISICTRKITPPLSSSLWG